MTEVIPYRPGHLDFIDPLDCYAEGAKDRIENATSNPNHTAFTLVKDRKPIAVVGFVQPHKGVLALWALAGKDIVNSPVFYHKTLKNLIEGHAKALEVKRVHSMVDCSNEAAIEQHLKLGFDIEAKLEKFGPGGTDQYLMRKLYG